MPDPLESLVERARAGDADALEAVVRAVQDRVFHLSLRFLADHEAAREATQEILTRVVTKLSTFEGRSAFTTWVHRIAVNRLLDQRTRTPGLTFEAFAEDLHTDLADPDPGPTDHVLIDEVRTACTAALLLCLPPQQRIAYVMGDVLELDHTEGSAALGISSAAYRKRLSRARAAVIAFTTRHCGLANPEAPCRCARRAPAAVALGRVRADARVWSSPDGPRWAEISDRVQALSHALQVLCLQRATPRYRCPVDLARAVAHIVNPD